MKVSYNWLKDYLDLSSYSHDELFKIFTFKICELEGYDKLIDVKNVVVGEVLTCESIPDTHLHLLSVEAGEGPTQIICGAPNIAQGQKVIVAKPGAVLPGNFKIKKSKIRGIESNGMVCALQELGIPEKYVLEKYKDGIYVLGDTAIPGNDPFEYLQLDDYTIDLDLTANRSDLLSVEGIAFDLGANLNQTVKIKEANLKEITRKNPISVTVDTDGCDKYLTRYISNVTVKESPDYIKSRLIACGIRPINNVVDVTNYILLGLGQPLHSFDADSLGNKIVVRNAKAGEKLKTLDNIDRDLEETDIIITDGEKPLCIAGVMGGKSTEVTLESKNIVLEAAYFEPLKIRKTSARLGLKSEASTRFERVIDFNRVNRALDLAAEMISTLGGGEVLSGVNGVVKKEHKPLVISVTREKINKVLGTKLTSLEVSDIFNRYGYSFTEKEDLYTLTVPSRRMDILDNYQDIIEDVARLYGYNNIPTVLPKTNDKGKLTKGQYLRRQAAHILSDMGLNEVINYSLVSEGEVEDFTTEKTSSVKILMPLTEERSVLKKSNINGLLGNIKYNMARKEKDLAFYELGKRYTEESEIRLLSGALTGNFTSSTWQGYKKEVDFFLVKGILDSLFTKFGIEANYEAAPELNSNLHDGRTAKISVGEVALGFIAEIHPKYAHENGLGRVIVFELNFDTIISLVKRDIKYTPLNKFPAVTRDLAIVVDKNITAGQIVDVVKMAAKKKLVDVSVFDVFEDASGVSNTKSIAVKIVLEDKNKTLETADVDKIIKSVLNRLDFYFQATLRE